MLPKALDPSLPVNMQSTAKSTPDVLRIVKFIRKLDRFFRVKRLTTRSWVDTLLFNHLDKLSNSDHLAHPALRDPAILENVYEQSRLLDLYHNMLLEDDFFDQPHVRSLSLPGRA